MKDLTNHTLYKGLHLACIVFKDYECACCCSESAGKDTSPPIIVISKAITAIL